MKQRSILLIAIVLILSLGQLFAQNANSTAVQFPLLTNTEVQKTDHAGMPMYNALAYLQNLPYVSVSETITGDTTSPGNVDNYIINLPVAAKILEAKFITTTPNSGTGNLPDVILLAGTDTVAITDSLALSRSAGAITTLTVTEAERNVASGTNLIGRVYTPSGATLTAAIKGKFQVIWKPRK